MKITKLTINGFQGENRHAEVNFSDDNVTVIYGDNGCGKTTFLKVLHLFLTQDESALLSLGIDSIECTVVNDGQEEYQCLVERYKEKSEEGYDWSSFKQCQLNLSRSLSLGIERGMSHQALKIDAGTIAGFFEISSDFLVLFRGGISTNQDDDIEDFASKLSTHLHKKNGLQTDNRHSPINSDTPHLYLQNIKIENIEDLLRKRYQSARYTATKKIQSALFDTLSAAIDINNSAVEQTTKTPEDFATRLLENRERIIEALDDGEQNNFKTQIIDILNSIEQQSELEKVFSQPLLLRLFINIINELEVEKLALSAINLLVDTFNRYLIEDKKLIVNRAEVFVKTIDARHSINELSSGERHILTFLALVLFEGEGRDFLIIDEPEISLNIKWQRELMGLFSQLLPNTQIIVASHAPALAKRHPGFLAKLNVFRG